MRGIPWRLLGNIWTRHEEKREEKEEEEEEKKGATTHATNDDTRQQGEEETIADTMQAFLPLRASGMAALCTVAPRRLRPGVLALHPQPAMGSRALYTIHQLSFHPPCQLGSITINARSHLDGHASIRQQDQGGVSVSSSPPWRPWRFGRTHPGRAGEPSPLRCCGVCTNSQDHRTTHNRKVWPVSSPRWQRC